MDKTETVEFRAEHADRLLAWEYVHGCYCAGKPIRPSRIADRIGLSTNEVRDMIEHACDRVRSQSVAR